MDARCIQIQQVLAKQWRKNWAQIIESLSSIESKGTYFYAWWVNAKNFCFCFCFLSEERQVFASVSIRRSNRRDSACDRCVSPTQESANSSAASTETCADKEMKRKTAITQESRRGDGTRLCGDAISWPTDELGGHRKPPWSDVLKRFWWNTVAYFRNQPKMAVTLM